MFEIIDQVGRKLCFTKIPKRIVSLVPSQTELLCDLGLKSHLIGITKFCVHPRDVAKKTSIVGGTKTIHLEKIKAIKPDIILCNKEENTKEIVEACEGICEVHVSDVFTIEDSCELIMHYGKLFNRVDQASVLMHSIQEGFQIFQHVMEKEMQRRVVYFIWKKPWMVAGSNTFINHILSLNKFKNVYGHLERYPEIHLNTGSKLEEVELVLLSSEPYPFKKRHILELQPFFPNAEIRLVDGEMFSWHGSRLLKALSYFKTLH